MRTEIAAVDLTVADEGAEYAELDAALHARGLACAQRYVPDPTLARGGHSTHDTLMARRIPGEIADFLERHEHGRR